MESAILSSSVRFFCGMLSSLGGNCSGVPRLRLTASRRAARRRERRCLHSTLARRARQVCILRS